MGVLSLLIPSVSAITTCLGVLVLGIAAYFVRALYFGPKPPVLPFPAAHAIPGNLTQSIIDARKQWPNEQFVTRFGPSSWVMLPHSLMTEIKVQPEEKVSFKKMSYDRFLGDYTGLGQSKSPAAINAIKIDLTRAVAKILNDLQDEADFAFDHDTGHLTDWTQLPVYPKVIQIVAACSGRAFVGLPLCRDAEWKNATINFTYDTIASVHAMKKYNKAWWPIVSPFIPELRKLHSYRDFAYRKLNPQIQTILENYKAKRMGLKTVDEDNADYEAIKHNYNLVHWTIGQHTDPATTDAAEVGHMHMTAAFAALSPIGMSISYAVFDLTSHPEIADVLRAEIRQVLEEEAQSTTTGRLSKSSLPKLRKLDSFMKESQRLNPPFLTTQTRIITAPDGLTLSTGHNLPHGATIAFGNPFLPGSDVSYPPLTNPTTDMPPLDQFYPWRFSDIRTNDPTQLNQHQFVTVDVNNAQFGYGRHACPGRFFAGNEIKVLISELVRRYDMALGPNGEGIVPGKFARPKTLEMGFEYGADPKAKVYFKSRNEVGFN